MIALAIRELLASAARRRNAWWRMPIPGSVPPTYGVTGLAARLVQNGVDWRADR